MGVSEFQFQQMLSRLQQAHGPLKAPVPVEEEGALADSVSDLCRSRGWGLIMARSDKRSTLRIGVHDATIFASNGRVFCFELKDREGKLSTGQQAWIAQMKHNGHKVHVVRSIQEVLDIVDGQMEMPP